MCRICIRGKFLGEKIEDDKKRPGKLSNSSPGLTTRKDQRKAGRLEEFYTPGSSKKVCVAISHAKDDLPSGEQPLEGVPTHASLSRA